MLSWNIKWFVNLVDASAGLTNRFAVRAALALGALELCVSFCACAAGLLFGHEAPYSRHGRLRGATAVGGSLHLFCKFLANSRSCFLFGQRNVLQFSNHYISLCIVRVSLCIDRLSLCIDCLSLCVDGLSLCILCLSVCIHYVSVCVHCPSLHPLLLYLLTAAPADR